MDAMLTQVVKQFKEKLTKEGLRCLREKAINYGCQVVCTDGKHEGTVNFYHGKKGLSVVVQGKDDVLKHRLTAIAKGDSAAKAPEREAPFRPQGLPSWIGCDESGKGDVFGPLAAAACLITAEEDGKLRRLGVCDSKLLKDTSIADIARSIRAMLGERAVVTVMMPEEYNKAYKKLQSERKNLNHLLGRIHGHNIRVLLSKYECPCIIVDKFGKDEYVLAGLQEEAKTHCIIQIPKGERDTAVAAASILARQAFVEGMEALAAKYGMTFPKGAYAGIDGAICAFRKLYGDEEFHRVGNLNFKTFDFLR